MEALAFASIISATDPVSVIAVFKELHIDKLCYVLVFGESIFNDVIGLTAFRSVMTFVVDPSANEWYSFFLMFATFFGSLGLGYPIGLLTALICKYFGSNTDVDDHIFSLDFSIMFLSPWISYLAAESLSLSGIVSIFFCGIALGQFATGNLARARRVFVRKTYGVISEICESISFIFIGVAVFGFNTTWDFFDYVMLPYAFMVILIARYLNIFIMTRLINLKRRPKVNSKTEFIMWFSGFRGAMAFALAIEAIVVLPDNDASHVGGRIFSLTLWLSIFTIMIKSPFIEPIVHKLGMTREGGNAEATAIIDEKENDSKTGFDKFKIKFSNVMHGIFTKKQKDCTTNNDPTTPINLDEVDGPSPTELVRRQRLALQDNSYKGSGSLSENQLNAMDISIDETDRNDATFDKDMNDWHLNPDDQENDMEKVLKNKKRKSNFSPDHNYSPNIELAKNFKELDVQDVEQSPDKVVTPGMQTSKSQDL